MKKLIFLLAAAGFIMTTQAQNQGQGVVKDSDVPNSVASAFKSAYPNVTDVKWRRDGSNYKTTYETAGNMDMIIVYDASGNLIKTKAEIESSQLPAGVMEYVSRNYDKETVKEAYRITDANGTVTYKAEVRGMHLMFDSQGKFMRSEKKDGDKSSSRL